MLALPFAVPSYGPEIAKRVVKAYIIRGMSRWLNNLQDPWVHPLDVVFLSGVRSQIALGFTVKIEPGNALHVVQQLVVECKPWARPANVDSLMWALSIIQRYSADQQDFEAVLAKAYYYHHCVYSRNRDTRMFDMKEDDASKLPADVYARLNSTLADLEATLLAKDAMMPQHLRNIHSLIISYPESTHLLKDEEIALIIGAAQEHTKVQIVSEAAKKATAPRAKSLKNVSVGDL